MAITQVYERKNKKYLNLNVLSFLSFSIINYSDWFDYIRDFISIWKIPFECANIIIYFWKRIEKNNIENIIY